MRSLLRLIVCTLGVGTSLAEPVFETTRVFEVAPQNKPNYRIPAILQECRPWLSYSATATILPAAGTAQ